MDPKTIVITGGTSGIGRKTAEILASQGHQIIITGRNEKNCTQTHQEIVALTKNQKLHRLRMDLTDRKQIEAAGNFLKCYISSIDVLINNAGTFEHDFTLIEEQYEKTFFVNHLAHFYFTRYVIGQMKIENAPRIINVSSMAHSTDFPLDQLNQETQFSPQRAYAYSKLANILFTNKLARLMKPKGITVNSLHPGVIDTKLLRKGWGAMGGSLEEGAATPVYMACSEEMEGLTGKYFSNQKESAPNPIAMNEKLQDQLWEYSLNVFGLQDYFDNI
jgi:NAD(P)-dependent dehydrogenase (short-subunit alcohol dehydrogenase family)